MNQLRQRCGLVLARFALSAWVGAAVLFVINGVRLVTDGTFDSIERDALALIRFPAYYVTGATLMAIAVSGLLLAAGLPELSRRRWGTVLLLTLLACGVMLGDYLWIYSPLAEMITPPGAARPAGFRWFHRTSETVNALQVGLCLAAAIIANWPGARAPGT